LRTGERYEILIVDDDPDVRRVFELHLSCENCNIRTASSFDQALNMLDKLDPEVISINVIDFVLDHGHNGVQLAIELAIRNRPCVNILITGSYEDYVMKYIAKFKEQIKAGDECCLFALVLIKPITGDRLRKAVNDCMIIGKNQKIPEVRTRT
jgi:DNA-binding NtrC family response regulator